MNSSQLKPLLFTWFSSKLDMACFKLFIFRRELEKQLSKFYEAKTA